jgi:geranylgeranyl pyrophosphate synthase
MNLSPERCRELLDARLQEWIRPIPFRSLKDPLSSLLAGGKRVRPLVTLLSCAASGGKAEDAVDAALAVELLHAASLVHDDVMDHASLRRGRPTVHKAYGTSAALLCGDYLVALAYRCMLETPAAAREKALGLMTSTYRTLCEGQALEEEVNGSGRPTAELLLSVIEKKTASLMELAAALGALIGKAGPEGERALADFGRNLGIAFQIQDDILDLTGSESETGKDSMLDVKNRKVTFARETSVATAERQSVRYMEEALSALRKMPPSDTRQALEVFAVSLIHRRA